MVNKQESYPDGMSVWRAEIELIDMSQKISNSFSSRWQVTMEVTFRPPRKEIEWSQRLRNPLGFTVTKFGLKPIKENDEVL